jgi:hypothetical protein
MRETAGLETTGVMRLERSVVAAAVAAAAAAIDEAIEMEIERGQRAIEIEIRTRSEESPGDALTAAAIEMEIERGQRAIEIEICEFVRNSYLDASPGEAGPEPRFEQADFT